MVRCTYLVKYQCYHIQFGKTKDANRLPLKKICVLLNFSTTPSSLEVRKIWVRVVRFFPSYFSAIWCHQLEHRPSRLYQLAASAIILMLPDWPFDFIRASRSGNMCSLCSFATSIYGFRGSKIMKGWVGYRLSYDPISTLYLRSGLYNQSNSFHPHYLLRFCWMLLS